MKNRLEVMQAGGMQFLNSAARKMKRTKDSTFRFFDKRTDGSYRFRRPRCEAPGIGLEIIIYLAFLITFTLVVLYMRDPLFSFQHNELMKDLFLEEEFPDIKTLKTFSDIVTVEELWQYMEGVFIQGLLSDQGAGPGVMYGTNWLIGSARVRQVRVKEGLCTVPKAFQAYITDCHGRYALGQDSRVPYGPGGVWTYQSESQLGSGPTLARWRRYDGGGYVHDIGSFDLETEISRLAYLKNNSWIDRQTRAVFIDFSTYNPNVNLFDVIQLQFEFLPSGGIYPDYKFRVLRLYRMAGPSGRWFLAGEILLVIFVCFFVGEELAEIFHNVVRHRKWARSQNRVADSESVSINRYQAFKSSLSTYLKDGWNYFDLLNITLFLAVVSLRLKVLDKFDDLGIIPSDRSRFVNMQGVVFFDSTEKNILAANAFLLWFKVFKYTSFEPRMSMIARVCSRAFRPLLLYILMFSFVLFGFAQAGSLAFGADVAGFDTLGLSIYTILLATLGQLDFEALRHSNRVFGPLFYFVFVLLVYFVLLAMFLAIIDSAYNDVARDLARSKEPTFVKRVMAWVSTTNVGRKIVKRLNLQKKAVSLHRSIRRADTNQDGMLDRDELMAVMSESRGFFDGGDVDEVMATYDLDNDNKLSPEERNAMAKDLLVHQHSIAQKIINLRDGGDHEFNTLFDLLSDRVDKTERKLESEIERLVAMLDPFTAQNLRARRLSRAQSLSTQSAGAIPFHSFDHDE